MVILRPAKTNDADAILEIYAPYVLNTSISFESDVPLVDEIKARIEKCLVRFPWLVCYINDVLAGYAYGSIHRERAAYQWTCECSVYLNNQFKGKGIAAEIYEALFSILKLQGIRNVYAGITLPNDASVSLHEKCGFEHFATYESIGYKLGGWQKVGWWRLLINDLNEEPSPPIYFSQLDRHSISEIFNEAARRIQSRIISHTDLPE